MTNRPLTPTMRELAKDLRARARKHYRQTIGALKHHNRDTIRVPGWMLETYKWHYVRGLLNRGVMTFDGDRGYTITMDPHPLEK